MKREHLIQHVSEQILSRQQDHPIRVGIDGIDASGKTTFSKELAAYLSQSRREIIRASIDGFHNPKRIRYQQGRNSPQGYYSDSFNLEAIRNHLLIPLSREGDLQYATEIFDYRTDSYVHTDTQTASPHTILIMEGVFLFRPELAAHWDFKIFLQISFAQSLERALMRDGHHLGTSAEIKDMYQSRYIPGQKLYFDEAKPEKQADIVIDNNDVRNPRISSLSIS